MIHATTATVTNPERYHAIQAFHMTRDVESVVLAAVKAAGFDAGRAKRGGLVIGRKGLMLRLTDEAGAPPLRLKAVQELIGRFSEGVPAASSK